MAEPRAQRPHDPEGAGGPAAVRAGFSLPPLSRLLPPLVWMLLIYLVSDRPDIPSAPAPLWDFLIKKGLHALAYAILLWLWWRALELGVGVELEVGVADRSRPDENGAAARSRRARRSALLLAWLITLLWAASDEWHQSFVPGRSGRLRDVLIDGAGASLAALWIARRTKRRAQPGVAKDG